MTYDIEAKLEESVFQFFRLLYLTLYMILLSLKFSILMHYFDGFCHILETFLLMVNILLK